MIDQTALTLRPALLSDLPRLLALLADDVLGNNRDAAGGDDACYRTAFDAIDKDANQCLLVGEFEGKVIAMLQLTFIPGLSRRGALRANIEAVRVDSALRGRGVGSWLMRRAIEAAKARGCALVQLTSDESRKDAHRLYERLGFTGSHRGFKLRLVDD